MEPVCEDDLCWLQLEDHRMILIRTIEPSRITPYLRQCQVISAEDEEQIFSDPALGIRSRRVGALLDLLQRTGVKGHTAFLESLELDYPRLYSRITGKVPNKTFSILVDTAGESGLTQFLMSELSLLQTKLQEERRRRQQACAAAEEQEARSQQLRLKEQELRKLSERLSSRTQEAETLTQQVTQLQQHNYTLMADINTLHQDRSAALLANKDLQIEVERVKNSLLQAENRTRVLRRRTQQEVTSCLMRSSALLPPQRRCLTLPSETTSVPSRSKETEVKQKEEEEREGGGEKEEKEEKEEKKSEVQEVQVLTTALRLQRDLHRAQEQRTQALEEKEEAELRCAELRGDVRVLQQRDRQTLRQMDEVIGERDKALALWAELQEETRRLLQEKDRYREQVRRLTLQSDRLDLQLMRSQGEELQLRTRLRTLTCNTHQSERSASEEEEEPAEVTDKGSEQQQQQEGEGPAAPPLITCPIGDAAGEEPSSTASWEKQTDACLTPRSAPTFFYRRKRALRSKCKEPSACRHDDDDSSSSDVTEWD